MKPNPVSSRELLACSRFARFALGVSLVACTTAHAQIFVSNWGGDSIVQYTAGGSSSVFASGGSIDAPYGLDFDNSGNLYVVNAANNKMVKFTGSTPSDFVTSGLTSPAGLATDNSGTFLFVANYSAGSIVKVDSGGTVTPFATGLGFVNGLAFDSGGNLYVAATGASASSPRIVKYTGGTPSDFITTNLNDPKGLAFDASDNLYVANAGNSTIYKFDTGANGTLFADSADSLSTPYGVALDSGGNVFVTNFGNGTVLKFTSGGVGSSFATGLTSPTLIAISAVPEPSTYAVWFGLGALAFTVCRRRHRIQSFRFRRLTSGA